MVDLKVDAAASFALSEKLRKIDAESSCLVEIPRLQVSDKISIQLMFLSRFPGSIHEVCREQCIESNGALLGRV